MNKIAFTKMHGAGNDFVMIDDMDEKLPLSGTSISAICARHTGVGADGLILLRPASGADFRMRYYNRDGGEAEMCGNGARCTALFARIRGIARDNMTFMTGAGPVSAELTPAGVRIGISDVTGLKLGIRAGSGSLETGYAVCGVPHAVHVVDDVDAWESDRFREIGRSVRMDPVFAPGGANFNIVSIEDRHRVRYRTYERGVEDETLACGTGAVALVAVCSALGLVDPPVTCRTSSGDILDVDMTPSPGGAVNCRLHGPAVVSFTGELSMDHFGD